MLADVFRMLQAFVDSRSGPSGIEGRICFGIRSAAEGDIWWQADLGANPKTEFVDCVSKDANAVLFMGEAEALAILEGGPTPLDPMVLMQGDGRLIEQFLERYLAKRSMLDVRVAAAPSAPKKRSRRNRR